MIEKKKSPLDWERAIDRQIREAMERGEFDNLPGAGKPLDLTPDPNTPADWQLAFKILKDAGVAPEWIELNKEIHAERRALAFLLEQQARWQCERVSKLTTLPPNQMMVEREHLNQARERTSRIYRERAVALNQLIDTFNLKAPNPQLHHARIRIDEQLHRFEEACQE